MRSMCDSLWNLVQCDIDVTVQKFLESTKQQLYGSSL